MPPRRSRRRLNPGLVLGLTLLLADTARASPTRHDALCAELAATERDFCALVASKGIATGFAAYMAPDVFLPDSLSLGKSEYDRKIASGQSKPGARPVGQPDPDIQLTWSPFRVEVSDDGTLGYTWGRFDYVAKGRDGKLSTDLGIYLTIWRRQPDGSWKFVYDGSPELPADPAALRAFLARPDLPHPGP